MELFLSFLRQLHDFSMLCGMMQAPRLYGAKMPSRTVVGNCQQPLRQLPATWMAIAKHRADVLFCIASYGFSKV